MRPTDWEDWTDEQIAEQLQFGRFITDPRKLRAIAGAYARRFQETHKLASLFPLYGISAANLSRGAYADCSIWRRWTAAAGAKALQLYLRHWHKHRPGWNDAFMAAWFMTGAPPYAEEIYHRCMDGSEVVAGTARWMTHSVRLRHSDFDLALRLIEDRTGHRIPYPQPPLG
jgi:hypothetical protein